MPFTVVHSNLVSPVNNHLRKGRYSMLEKLVNNVLQLDSNSLTKVRGGNIIPYRGDLNQTLYEQTPIYRMTHKYKLPIVHPIKQNF